MSEPVKPTRRYDSPRRREQAAATRAQILDAATVDPDIGELWRRIESDFYDNQRAIVESLDAKGALRRGLDVARATDILWTLNHPDVWQLLVTGRGWTAERWEHWFSDTASAQLLHR